jgi:hypothetical protein
MNRVSYGETTDEPFVGVSEPVADRTVIDAAFDALQTMSGGDTPESGIEALNVPADGPVHPDVTSPMVCSAGRVEGGCWHTGAVQVIVMSTDAMSHNGPDPSSAALSDP